MMTIVDTIRVMMSVLSVLNSIAVFSHTIAAIELLFLLLGLLLFELLGFGHVSLVEEVEKEHEIREVHDRGPLDVLIAHIARLAGTFAVVSDTVDVNADDHLEDLSACDGDVYPFGDLESESAKRVV